MKSTYSVGQEVILFGVGRVLGKVVSVFPSVDVQSEAGFLRFDENGKETDDSRYLRCGAVLNGPCPSFLPWEIIDASDEELAAWKEL